MSNFLDFKICVSFHSTNRFFFITKTPAAAVQVFSLACMTSVEGHSCIIPCKLSDQRRNIIYIRWYSLAPYCTHLATLCV